MLWTNVRTKQAPLWQWVYVRAHASEEFYYPAFRTIFGKWKFKSGFYGKIDQHNVWCNISTYKNRTCFK